MSSFWWNFHHWLHWKLSKWQLPVQPVIKISSKWRHFRFSEGVKMYTYAILVSLVPLLQNSHNRHSIAPSWGRGMGSRLCVQGLIFPTVVIVAIHAISCIFNSVITIQGPCFDIKKRLLGYGVSYYKGKTARRDSLIFMMGILGKTSLY